MRYYIIYNEQQQGPMEKEQLVNFGLNYNSLVWTEGLPSWTKASAVEELRQYIDMLNAQHTSTDSDVSDYYYMMVNNAQVGPFPARELLQHGLRPETPVWKSGMRNWTPASQVPEVASLLIPQTPPPFGVQPPQQPQYAPGQNVYYEQQQPVSNRRSTWLTPAIISTILGFLCSCIGLIFGVIAIVKANNANKHFIAGNIEQAEMEESSAKTMTIIAFVLAGLGAICSGIYSIAML